MKRSFLLALAAICLSVGARAQYFETTRRTIPTPQDQVTSNPCDPAIITRSLAFGFEPLREDYRDLDIAVAKMVLRNPSIGDPLFYPFTFAHNQGGNFPNPVQFVAWEALCHSPLYIKKMAFGNLRPYVTPPRRDLAAILDGFPHRMILFHNILDASPGVTFIQAQHVDIGSDAVDGTWGAFSSNDVLEDLAVTDPNNSYGPEVRIYRNLGNGYLDDQEFLTFAGGNDYKAQRIVFAQIDRPLATPPQDSKLDLVGIDSIFVKIWRNDNNNGLPNEAPYKQVIDLQFGTATSLEVADINNDGYNDILVGSMQGARLFLNTANSNGDIDDNAYWAHSNPIRKHLIAVGDIGSPGSNGNGRLDGWNDLVVASANNDGIIVFRIFINQKGVNGEYFTTNPQETIVNQPPSSGGEDEEEEQQAPCNPDEPLDLQLADVKTNGGLSIVYRVYCDDSNLHLFHNNGNPAPAPPTGVAITATPPDQYGYSHPKLTWKANGERDLAGYEVWRMTTGAICGTTNWSCINDNVPATQTEFIDYGIGTVMPGGDCIAKYVLKAKDFANNVSDPSSEVQINYASYFWKLGEQDGDKPQTYAVHAAYPNPFNPSTQIKFDLAEDSFVSLHVFDVLGRKVVEIVNGTYAAGYHSAVWNASGIASGVYIARFTATDVNGNVRLSSVSKLVLTK